MQEYKPEFMDDEDLPNAREIFEREVSESRKEFESRMDEAVASAEGKGYKYVGRRKIGRNEPCPCNSGKKFKKCCIPNKQ